MQTKSEQFSPDEIYIIQTRQLRKTIHYVYQRSPFYRDFFDRQGIQPAEVKSLADLALLPTTSQEQFIQASRDRFLCVRPGEISDIAQIPLPGRLPFSLSLTEADLTRLSYHDQLSLYSAGIQEKDMVALCIGQDAGNTLGLSLYLGLRRIGATTLRVGQLPTVQLLDMLERMRPSVVIATPTYLKQIMQAAERMHKLIATSGVKKLICVGDSLQNIKMQPNTVWDYFMDNWKGMVHSAYCNPETTLVLCDCEFNQGMHVHPELAHVEVVDANGKPLPDNQVGELCITPFGITGMPLLRYRTGELTFVQNQRCACGRATTRLGPRLGPVGGVLEHQGQKIYPSQLISLVQAEPGVRNFLWELTSAENQTTVITLWLAVDEPDTARLIAQRILANLQLTVAIQLVSDAHLQSRQAATLCSASIYFSDQRISF